jgi:beta-lactamase class A
VAFYAANLHTVKLRLVLIALLLAGCGNASWSITSARATDAAPVPSPEVGGAASQTAGPRPASHAASPALIVTPEVADRIDALLARRGGHAAVIVASGSSGEILHASAPDEPVFAASLYKLGVLLEAERRIDAGTLTPSDLITVTAADQAEGGSFTAAGSLLSIDEALERTIVLSDNAAALALIRRLGISSIQATLDRERIHLQFTTDGAITTARGIATFFGELVRGSLVSREASARMLARLSRQRAVDRLPAALPAGAVVAHKTGNLGFVTHDAGIVNGPGGAPVVLVVLTWDCAEQQGIDLIKEIARLAYQGLART